MEQLLKSKYRIGQKLSENPFSVTYQGYYIGTEKPVIIKIYKRGTLNSARIKSMKQRVMGLSLISHHGIAKLIDGDYGWQGFYYVREFIQGETIQDHLGRGENFGIDKGSAIADQALEALAAVHAKGVIHGALKPANIFIDQKGIVRLADFVVDGEIKSAMPQKVHELMANAKYASPEELEGEPATVSSDIYAMGMILYEMAVGKSALAEAGLTGNLAKLNRITLFSKEELITLPGYLREIISRATQKDPLSRFASAEEFRSSLEHRNILRKNFGNDELVRVFETVVTQYGGEDLSAESEALEDVGRIRLRWGKEKHRHWILIAVMAAAVVLGVIYSVFLGR